MDAIAGELAAVTDSARPTTCTEFVLDECIRLEHSFQALVGVTWPVADLSESLEVSRDLTLMPGKKDRLDVREVLVERGAADAGLLGDLRHRDRPQAVLGHEPGRRCSQPRGSCRRPCSGRRGDRH